ncbi:MAG: ABC transporter permease subunit [Saccharofermentans sp.]|nr:ABC transporter permease subunit [Saccharofermentans sp.]
MNKLKKTDLIIIAVAVLLIAGIVLSVIVNSKGKSTVSGVPESEKKTLTYDEYNGKRAGIKTGSSFEPITFDKFPNSEYFYFDTDSDLITALITNKIDFFLEDQPVAAMEHLQQNSVDYLHEPIVNDDYHFGFPKDNDRSELLQSQFNEFLAKYKSDGKLDELKYKWIEGEESKKVINTSELSGENGKLVVAVLPDHIPFSYLANNQLVGYAVELTLEFAKEYGYSVTFEQANISSCLAGLASGKYDFFATSLSYTEERAQSIDFSDIIYNGGVVLIARSTDLSIGDDTKTEKASFFSSIAESFKKNFVTEARYQLILRGVGTTCIITALSVIIGSLFAFFICLFRRTDSLLANKIANLYVKLLQGTPMVVLLMILYYVVFGKSGINAIWVAVIGFSLNFAAYTSEILRSGIESIDGGQREAALALGYSENQAFFKFIFPQASVRQIPVYRGEIISLLKNTSIVGYIAIQDLTKMSDIIRSRTYEAFFPLIATAIIYFILAWIISLILNLVLKKIDPRAKKAKTAKEAIAK